MSNQKTYDFALNNINLEGRNNSTNLTAVVYNQAYNSPIIDNTKGDKKLCITRLSVPTSNIQLLNFTNRTDYKIGIYGYNKYLNSTKGSFNLYSDVMPTETTHGVKYLNNNVIVEYMNRCLINSYTNFISSFTGLDTNAIPTPITRSNITFSNSSPTDTNTLTTTYNFGLTELYISNFTFNTALDDKEVFEIYLSRAGTEVIVFKDSVLTFKNMLNSRSSGQGLAWREGSFNLFSDKIHLKDNSIHFSQFAESCLKFQNVSPNGSWIVGVRSPRNVFNVRFSYNLVFFCGDNVTIPSQPPYLSITSDNSLQLNYQTCYVKNNHRFCLSSTLLPVLDFFNKYNFDTVESVYICEYESDILSTTLTDIIQLKQPDSKINKLKNLSRIIIKSDTLNTNQETFISADNTPLKDNSLTDFTINLDDTLGVNLVYTLDQKPIRMYNIPQGYINRLSFEIVALYSNGISSPIYLNTGENYLIRFSIF